MSISNQSSVHVHTGACQWDCITLAASIRNLRWGLSPLRTQAEILSMGMDLNFLSSLRAYDHSVPITRCSARLLLEIYPILILF